MAPYLNISLKCGIGILPMQCNALPKGNASFFPFMSLYCGSGITAALQYIGRMPMPHLKTKPYDSLRGEEIPAEGIGTTHCLPKADTKGDNPAGM
jgi:hypothetical protein